MNPRHVLVTGGSGFIAGHCILQLLARGHRVRATLRSVDKQGSVRDVLAHAGMAGGDRLAFVAADLLDDAGWAQACAGIDDVMHVASPVMPGHVANEDDVIVPAREGTLRVLRAARDAGARRVVLTSAFHAVSWGHPHDGHVFTEADWTILDGPGVDAYGKSKTLAERAAWDFVAAEGGALELAAMLPVAVMGPVMGDGVSGANHLVQRMLRGEMPGHPDLHIPIVDVRDVALAHVLALEHPDAAGQRFLLSNGAPLSMRQIGAVVRQAVGLEAARKVPKRALPSWLLRIMSLFNAELRHVVPDLGVVKKTSNERARRVLGWQPRPAQEAIAAAARSLAGPG